MISQIVMLQRPNSCVCDNLVEGQGAVIICCHEKIWREADPYERRGGLFARACEQCITGKCESATIKPNGKRNKENNLKRPV